MKARDKKSWRPTGRLVACPWLALVAMLVAAAGCGGKKSAPPPPPAAPKKVETASVIPTEEKSPIETYIYSPVGKRDPFKSAYKVVKTQEEKEKVGGILTQYEIDQLKLTAIITGIAKPRAQVELPDGRGVVVDIGTRIGKNFGRVVQIRNDELVIAEDFRDHVGRKLTNHIRIKLEKEALPKLK